MTKASGLDRALLHGLHQRLGRRPERVSDAALRAVLRVAFAYTQDSKADDSAAQEAIGEFDEDSLALVEVLAQTLLQLTTSGNELRFEEFG